MYFLETGFRFQGLPSFPLVHFNHLQTLLLTSWIVLFLLLSISSRDNNMPPKTRTPNDAIDYLSNHVAMPSNDGVINTSTDTHNDSFSYPNVMLMAIAKL